MGSTSAVPVKKGPLVLGPQGRKGGASAWKSLAISSSSDIGRKKSPVPAPEEMAGACGGEDETKAQKTKKDKGIISHCEKTGHERISGMEGAD